ncbi:hypothetical protein PR048_019119 [Dryococelus australis]|uniref:Uncharacterized protein n=1 Tax=Dryococelus australis TaxID=614101 RepID=A0ABQ9H2Z7_9NEOP|nr:hypothetical protein PR048_019119 [Dryococelus australis]
MQLILHSLADNPGKLDQDSNFFTLVQLRPTLNAAPLFLGEASRMKSRFSEWGTSALTSTPHRRTQIKKRRSSRYREPTMVKQGSYGAALKLKCGFNGKPPSKPTLPVALSTKITTDETSTAPLAFAPSPSCSRPSTVIGAEEWQRILFSDESRFYLYEDDDHSRLWHHSGRECNASRTSGVIVQVSSVTTLSHVSCLFKARREHSCMLVRLCHPIFYHYLRCIPNAIMKQDIACSRTVCITQQALQDVDIIPWPATSQDSPLLMRTEYDWVTFTPLAQIRADLHCKNCYVEGNDGVERHEISVITLLIAPVPERWKSGYGPGLIAVRFLAHVGNIAHCAPEALGFQQHARHVTALPWRPPSRAPVTRSFVVGGREGKGRGKGKDIEQLRLVALRPARAQGSVTAISVWCGPTHRATGKGPPLFFFSSCPLPYAHIVLGWSAVPQDSLRDVTTPRGPHVYPLRRAALTLHDEKLESVGTFPGRRGVMIRLLASHVRETGSIPAPKFCTWELCRTMPVVGEFSQGFPVSPHPLHSAAARCSSYFTLIGSQHLDDKRRPNISTWHLSRPLSAGLEYLALWSSGAHSMSFKKQQRRKRRMVVGRLSRRGDRELGVHASIARIVPPLLGLKRAKNIFGYTEVSNHTWRGCTIKKSERSFWPVLVKKPSRNTEIVYGWKGHLKINPMIPIKTPYYRLKRCRERKINTKASERVNPRDPGLRYLADGGHVGRRYSWLPMSQIWLLFFTAAFVPGEVELPSPPNDSWWAICAAERLNTRVRDIR